MTRTATTALYVQGDGGLVKLGKGAMAKVAAGAYYADVGRELKAIQSIDGVWKHLPAALFQMDSGSNELTSSVKGVEVTSYDYPDYILHICKEAS